MEPKKTIPQNVADIIPHFQYIVTKENLDAFIPAIEKLEQQLAKCPKFYETDGMKEHPAIFHYFYGGTDMYICEYEPKEEKMFGFIILNGDLQNSEWGYISLAEIKFSKYLNIDYHFEEQSIEAALYKAYPNHYKKPKSLKNN